MQWTTTTTYNNLQTVIALGCLVVISLKVAMYAESGEALRLLAWSILMNYAQFAIHFQDIIIVTTRDMYESQVKKNLGFKGKTWQNYNVCRRKECLDRRSIGTKINKNNTPVIVWNDGSRMAGWFPVTSHLICGGFYLRVCFENDLWLTFCWATMWKTVEVNI